MTAPNDRRVVISGLGVVSSVGCALATFWDNLVNGRSGVTALQLDEPDRFPSRVAGHARDFDPLTHFDPKEARRMDRFVQFAVAAGEMAVADARLKTNGEDPANVGCLLGSGIGGLQTVESQYRRLYERGPRAISPFLIPMMITDMASGQISIRNNFKGPNLCVVTACATAAHAIAMAFRSIKFGDCDVYVAGGSEAAITELGMGGFCSMNALSSGFNDEPARASRPFDAKRDGFVMSEGAGVCVLEEYEHARQRNAPIYAELLAVGMSGDAHHMAAPEPEGRGAEQAMRMALRQSGITPEQVQYINAHGTSTPLGDISEVAAIHRLFGDDTPVIVSSTKSMTGHTLGAAGGIELAATLLSMKYGVVPPTINYEFPDEQCRIDCVPNKAREVKIDLAMSNSFGFGGHNASVLVRRLDD